MAHSRVPLSGTFVLVVAQLAFVPTSPLSTVYSNPTIAPRADARTVSLIFHVIHDPTDTSTYIDISDLQDQVTALNTAYNSATYDDYSFQIAAVIYHADADLHEDVGPIAYDEDVESLVIDAEHYVNVVIGDMPAGYYGWSTWPDAYYAPDGQKNQILLDYLTLPNGPEIEGWDDGDTLVHEMGHYLGHLEHVFDEDNGCFDYDAPDVQDTNECNLGSTIRSCPWGDPFQSCPGTLPNGDPISNYMHYTTDACRTVLSNGQHARLDSLFENKRLALDHSSDEITIPSGHVVTIDSAEFYIAAGYGIKIEGTFNITNSEFLALNSSWGGIEFSSGSGGSISNSAINDVAGTYAVRITDASPTLDDVDIEYGGIYVSGSSAFPVVKYVRILDGTVGLVYTNSAGGTVYMTYADVSGHALETSYYADPWVGTFPGCCGGYNRFDGASVGIYSIYMSTAYAGNASYDGFNDLCTASGDILAAHFSSTLYADDNFWPNQTIENTSTSSGGVINATNVKSGASDCSEPSWRVGSVLQPEIRVDGTLQRAFKLGAGSSDTDAAIDLLAQSMGEVVVDQAVRLRAESAVLFRRVVSTRPGTDLSAAALRGLFRLARMSDDRSYLSYLENLGATDGPDQAAAMGQLIQAYRYWGDRARAYETARALRTLFADEWLENYARFSLFELDLEDGDLAGAHGWLTGLVPYSDWEASRLEEAWSRLESEGIPAGPRRSRRGDAGPIDSEAKEGIVRVTAFPNPFNPTVEVRVKLRSAGSTRVSAFDALGREVAVLTAGHAEPGVHLLRWDASALPSGLYFIVVRAGIETMTQSVTLMK